jgi:hypothetical protein
MGLLFFEFQELQLSKTLLDVTSLSVNVSNWSVIPQPSSSQPLGSYLPV